MRRRDEGRRGGPGGLGGGGEGGGGAVTFGSGSGVVKSGDVTYKTAEAETTGNINVLTNGSGDGRGARG